MIWPQAVLCCIGMGEPLVTGVCAEAEPLKAKDPNKTDNPARTVRQELDSRFDGHRPLHYKSIQTFTSQTCARSQSLPLSDHGLLHITSELPLRSIRYPAVPMSLRCALQATVTFASELKLRADLEQCAPRT